MNHHRQLDSQPEHFLHLPLKGIHWPAVILNASSRCVLSKVCGLCHVQCCMRLWLCVWCTIHTSIQLCTCTKCERCSLHCFLAIPLFCTKLSTNWGQSLAAGLSPNMCVYVCMYTSVCMHQQATLKVIVFGAV